jgi:hypothetical protein
MYDCSRNEDAMPHGKEKEEGGGFGLLREVLIRAGADPEDEVGLELACVAAWCTAHGISEMASFAQFRPLIETLGGEEAFYRRVLEHVGLRTPRTV